MTIIIINFKEHTWVIQFYVITMICFEVYSLESETVDEFLSLSTYIYWIQFLHLSTRTKFYDLIPLNGQKSKLLP